MTQKRHLIVEVSVHQKSMTASLVLWLCNFYQSMSHTTSHKKKPLHCNHHNGKAMQGKMIEDGSFEDPTSISHLYSFSDMDFNEKIMKMFKKLKEIMELTANKTQDDVIL